MLTTEVTPASTGSSNTLQEVDVETSVRMESMMTTKTTASTVTTRMLSEPSVTTKPLQVSISSKIDHKGKQGIYFLNIGGFRGRVATPFPPPFPFP